MEKLTNKEEEVMRVLWGLKKAFVKEIIAEFPEPKPHYNTISTIIRIMEEKGLVAHHAFGKSHQYYPLISEETYKKRFLGGFVEKYFSNSYKEMLNFFAQEEKINEKDVREILDLIRKQKKK